MSQTPKKCRIDLSGNWPCCFLRRFQTDFLQFTKNVWRYSKSWINWKQCRFKWMPKPFIVSHLKCKANIQITYSLTHILRLLHNRKHILHISFGRPETTKSMKMKWYCVWVCHDTSAFFCHSVHTTVPLNFIYIRKKSSTFADAFGTTIISRLLTLRASLPNNVSSRVFFTCMTLFYGWFCCCLRHCSRDLYLFYRCCYLLFLYIVARVSAICSCCYVLYPQTIIMFAESE